MTVHQFGPIYPTEIIEIVQCMNADYVIWMVAQVGGWMTCKVNGRVSAGG